MLSGTADAQSREEALVAAAREGDVHSFEQLVLIHQERAFNIACRLLGQREDAEDATQEAFVRAYRGLAKFTGQARFGTWFTRILINVCRTYRGRRQRCTTAVDPEIPEIRDEAPGPAEAAVQAQVQKAVREALAELPLKYREVLTLFELEGMSYEEIAQVLRRPVGTIRSRLNRARLALRDRLAGRVDLD